MILNLNLCSIQYYSNLINRESFRSKYPLRDIKPYNQLYSNCLPAGFIVLEPDYTFIKNLLVNSESISRIFSTLLDNFIFINLACIMLVLVAGFIHAARLTEEEKKKEVQTKISKFNEGKDSNPEKDVLTGFLLDAYFSNSVGGYMSGNFNKKAYNSFYPGIGRLTSHGLNVANARAQVAIAAGQLPGTVIRNVHVDPSKPLVMTKGAEGRVLYPSLELIKAMSDYRYASPGVQSDIKTLNKII